MANDPNLKGRAIFISYRRSDTEGEAGRLYDDLVRAYGDDSVFMDVSGIEPGLDFRKAIDANVASCGVLLAVIGPTWATLTGSDGQRRLDNPNDYVRLEIASALARGVAVIPVLVHAAKMPPLDQLPDDLKDLRYRNSVELTHARWNSDVALLIGALKSYVSANPANQTETVHATVPVQLPAPQPAQPAGPAKSKLPLFGGLSVAVVVAIAVAVGVALHHGSTPVPQPVVTTPDKSANTQPAPLQPAVAADEAALLGKWKRSEEPNADDGLARLEIADFGGQITVQAWGKCPGHPCEWGSRQATLQGGILETKDFDLHNTPQEISDERSAKISIASSPGGLQVTVKNTLRSAGGATKSKLNPLQFVKMP